MNVVIVTQEDSFVIPENIERILAVKEISVSKIIVLDAKGSLVNKKRFFVEGFGLRQSAKMGLLLARNKVLNQLDSLAGFHLTRRKFSIEAVAKKHGCPYEVLDGSKKKDLYLAVKACAPDLVVSFSAPSVFGPKLLATPKLGCINLHCSYLPYYAGLMPSFWTLYHEEPKTGVTVHYMDDKIDNGQILMQDWVRIDPGMSMYELIRRTKRRGGELMVEVIRQFQRGSIQPKDNHAEDGSYFSWPTKKQLQEFRQRGGRLI